MGEGMGREEEGRRMKGGRVRAWREGEGRRGERVGMEENGEGLRVPRGSRLAP